MNMIYHMHARKRSKLKVSGRVLLIIFILQTAYNLRNNQRWLTKTEHITACTVLGMFKKKEYGSKNKIKRMLY